MKVVIKDSPKYKLCSSDEYNYVFCKENGFFARWGKTKEDDPVMAPAPEIMDLEISTVCNGINGKVCAFCYKANTPKGKQMSFETFKILFDKLPKSVTQIAFGIGNLWGHNDMWKIFDYTREQGVIPNVTTNGDGLTDEIADRLAATMGAVAVSRYNPKDCCYEAVKALADRGMKQVNIHQLVCEETYQDCLELLDDAAADPRLAGLNAIVFLMLKPKRRGEGMTKLSSPEKYQNLINLAFEKGISVGFDSCSAPSFLNAAKDRPDIKQLQAMSDPCESGLFSIYANVDGEVFPCSFTEETPGWETGLSILECDDFVKDIWNHPKMLQWKKRLIQSTSCDKCGGCTFQSSCRSCPVYDVNLCKNSD